MSTKNYKVGDTVFYLNEDKEAPGGEGHGWSLGTLKTLSQGTGAKAFYEVEDGAKTWKVVEEKMHTHMEGSYSKEVSDLFGLGDLHSATLLYCLKDRYCIDDMMYTRMGEMIISINPFCRKSYNDEDVMGKHMKMANPKDGPAHIWEVANKAYVKIIKQDMNNQSILISGESGAGKTEATKTMIEYLGRMSMSLVGCTAVQKEIASSLNKKLKACNPVLESFGNAKTERNDNSSRFGKYIKLYFNKASGALVGAQMEHYLLEKSRIVTQNANERGYHVFYEMLLGMTAEQKAKYGGLTRAQDYPNLNKGNQFERVLNGKVVAKDDDNFLVLCQAFNDAGVTTEEQDLIFRALAAILHLTQVEYAVDESTGKAKISNPDQLKKVSDQLDIDAEEFSLALLTLSKTAMMTKFASVPEAQDMRDALAKALYSGIFDWLVMKLNDVIKPSEAALAGDNRYIGLLDIFGFEKFKVNTFEQFCINYTNESLQNHYNGYTFVQDELECKQEGIAVPAVEYPDNAKCLAMLDKPKSGVFALLDEACKASVGTDASFTEAVWSGHSDNKEYFSKPRSTNPDRFTVKHYAADVEYQSAGWKEKNSDTLKNPMKQALLNSKVEWFQTLLPPMIDEKDRSAKGPSTVSLKFKAQMLALRTELSATESHFVRTVKPNPQMKPGIINNATVMAQLTSAGVIETIKMKRAGYPVRLRHRDFYLRYRLIAPTSVLSKFKNGKQPADGDELKAVCKEIGSAILTPVKGVPQFDIGHSKVFCKAEANDKLEGLRGDAIEDGKNISRAFLYRWTLSWDTKRKELAEALKVRKEEEAAIREEKRAIREAELKAQGKTEGSLPGQASDDFSDLAALFPHFDIPIIADAVRVAHKRFSEAEAHGKAREYLLDMERARLAGALPVSVAAIFEEAKLSAKTQKSLTDAGVTHRHTLFNLSSRRMEKLGFSGAEQERLESVMLSQQSAYVNQQRLQVIMEAGNRTEEDVARDIAALNKAAATIQKQIDGAEAGRLVGEKISLARTGYSHEQVVRFISMGFEETKVKAALRKAKQDPVKASELLLAAV